MTAWEQDYSTLLLFFMVSGVLSGFLLILSYYLSFRPRKFAEKLSAYECGFEPFGEGQSAFDVHFYVVGILFIIFDLEIVFLFPWALTLTYTGYCGFISMFFFLFILTLGFIYEWKKGALTWSQVYKVY